MATKIVMPDVGESVIEGTIQTWLKREGEAVSAGEVLVEIETDKVAFEIESEAAGVVLKIATPEETVVEVGQTLAWVGKAGETIPETSHPTPAEKPIEAKAPVESAISSPAKPARAHANGFISPVVRRIAHQHELDLSQITGTGRRGRITKKDVIAFLEREPAPRPSATPASAPSDADFVKLTPIRKAIAKRMTQSKSTIPHVTAVVEVDLHKVSAHRKANKPAFEREGVKLTYMAYVIVAVAKALKTHRMVNSSWGDDRIWLHRHIHLGIAVDLGDKGLIAPVIHNAADYSLLGAARALQSQTDKARSGSLTPQDTAGATYTLTNYGGNGSLMASPIISPPQCAILGLGKIEKRPVVRELDGEDVVVVRPMMYISHTYDHRILDGGASARFLKDLLHTLEQWPATP